MYVYKRCFMTFCFISLYIVCTFICALGRIIITVLKYRRLLVHASEELNHSYIDGNILAGYSFCCLGTYWKIKAYLLDEPIPPGRCLHPMCFILGYVFIINV